MLKIILTLFLLAVSPGAWAATYEASPSGSGSTCSTASPCSLRTLVQTKLAAGDTGLLQDGTYSISESTMIVTGAAGTSSNRITLRAKNRHLAILSFQDGANWNGILQVSDSFWTISGIVFQGNKRKVRSCIWLFSSSTIQGIRIDDNKCLNSGGSGFQFWGVSNSRAWYNWIDGTGYNPEVDGGSPFYVSTASQWPVNGLDIFGNYINDSTNNLVDYKGLSTNVNVHHNLFENHAQVADHTPTCPTCGANDGVIKSDGSNSNSNNFWNNNIVRHIPGSGHTAVVRLETNEVDGTGNVFYDIPNETVMWRGRGPVGTHNWTGNTMCTTPTADTSDNPGSIVTTGNSVNQAQGVCDTQVARIISEIAARPTVASMTIADGAPTVIDIVWVNNKFPPLASVDNAKITCTVNATPRTVNSSIILGTQSTRHTLASAVSAGDIVACSGAAGLVINSGVVGATWISDLASSAAFTAQPVTNNVQTASTCTHYAGATTQGSADGSSEANRFLINSFWAVASAGDILCLSNGTYQGANSMIAPPAAKKGLSGSPITVKAINDGLVRIDGQGARVPVNLTNDNDWFVLEGFNANGSSGGSVVSIGNGSDNVIVRRVAAWDAPSVGNFMIFNIFGNTGTLLEDVAGWGNARKIFSFSAGGNNATCRRCFGIWMNSTEIGPKMVFTNSYDSFGTIIENPIAMWDGVTGSVNQPYALFGQDGMTTAASARCANSKYLGGIGIFRSGHTIPTDLLGMAFGSRSVDCTEFKDLVLYNDPGTHTGLRAMLMQEFDGGSAGEDSCSPTCDRDITNVSAIGFGTASSINTGSEGWTVTNVQNYGTVAAAPNIWNGGGTDGARVCSRYVDGTLTATNLWPWPMTDRINAALTDSGRNPGDYFGSGGNITTLASSIFGTIPTDCATTSAQGVLVQDGFRFEHLRGTEAAPTTIYPAAIANNRDVVLAPGAKYRVRASVCCANIADCPVFNARWRYIKNGGTATEFSSSFTDGIGAFSTDATSSDIPPHGTPTTQQITTGTFIPGELTHGPVSVPNVDLSQNSCTELVGLFEHFTLASVNIISEAGDQIISEAGDAILLDGENIVLGDTFQFVIYTDQGVQVHNAASAIVMPRVTIGNYVAGSGF